MHFNKTLKKLRWILPPVCVAVLGAVAIDQFADVLREKANTSSELKLIDYYAPQFQIIASVFLGLFTAGIEYIIYKLRSKYRQSITKLKSHHSRC